VTAPRTHALLRVEAEGRSHLVDVGFGGQTPSGPLLLVPGPEQATPHEPCRIDAVGPDEAREFVLQARIAGAWTPLYRFHLFEHVAIDHEVANHYVATHPASFFRNAIVAARLSPQGRHLLFNDRLAFQHVDGRREERILPDAPALFDALETVFGIAAPDRPALAAAFGRLTERPGRDGSD